MKIRTIKRKLKNKDKLTKKEQRQFARAITKCRSIRNTIIRGCLIQGDYSNALQLTLQDVKINGWTNHSTK